MNAKSLSLLLSLMFFSAACQNESSTDGDSSGIDIRVNEGGVEVDAPGVKVRTDAEGNTEVDAPGTRVRSDSEGNTEVDAPGAKVRTDSEGNADVKVE